MRGVDDVNECVISSVIMEKNRGLRQRFTVCVQRIFYQDCSLVGR